MFHNFIFFPLKITRYWNSKRSYQHLGMLKIFSWSKITGSSSGFCYSFGYRFCYRGSRGALFLFLKCGSYLEGVPPLHRLGPLWSLIWKPVVSRKLSPLWVGTSTSPHHFEKFLFSATQHFSMLRLPEMCLMYVKFWSWPSSQGELLSRFLVSGVPSLYLSPCKNSTLNPSSFANPYKYRKIQKYLSSPAVSWLGSIFLTYSLENLFKETATENEIPCIVCHPISTKNC